MIFSPNLTEAWPKAWAAFNMAKEIWTEEETTDDDVRAAYEKTLMFPVGNPNDAYAKYFVGQSYLYPLSTEQLGIFNVTDEQYLVLK